MKIIIFFSSLECWVKVPTNLVNDHEFIKDPTLIFINVVNDHRLIRLI